MTSGPVRTRTFVMLMAAWMAASLAPLAALDEGAAAAFAAVAAGLAAATTLRFSLAGGAAVGIVSAVVFAMALALGPAPPWTLRADALARLGESLLHLRTLGSDLLALVALLGTAVSAEFASVGLEWDAVLRTAMRERSAPGPSEQAGDLHTTWPGPTRPGTEEATKQ